jgi:hypothetical protein
MSKRVFQDISAIENFWYICKGLSSSPLILLKEKQDCESSLNSLVRRKEL